jgi:opacity protein-like surface antigen
MKRLTINTTLCAALAALSIHTQVHAESYAAKTMTGPYVGVALGAAFGNREIDDSNSSNDEHLGQGTKFFGGYQLTETFGVQAGYVRLKTLNQNTGSGTTLVEQTVTGHSTYMAGTARLPLGESFALTGKAGVSFGKVTDTHPSTTNPLLGSKTSLLIGSGIEYMLSREWSLAVELESYGKIARQVKGNTLSIGTRYTF